MAAGVAISIYPVMAVNEFGFSSDQYSYWMGILGAASAVIGLAFGPFIDRFGARRFLMLGFLLAITVTVTFVLAEPWWSSTPVVLAALIGSQIASQLIFVAVIAAFMGMCWTRIAATQFAVYMSLSNLARSVGAGLFAIIATDTSSVQALLIIAGLHVLGALLLILFSPAKHLTRLSALDRSPAAPVD